MQVKHFFAASGTASYGWGDSARAGRWMDWHVSGAWAGPRPTCGRATSCANTAALSTRAASRQSFDWTRYDRLSSAALAPTRTSFRSTWWAAFFGTSASRSCCAPSAFRSGSTPGTPRSARGYFEGNASTTGTDHAPSPPAKRTGEARADPSACRAPRRPPSTASSVWTICPGRCGSSSFASGTFRAPTNWPAA